ncbi:polyprenol monophosphomannose synthase [Cutibacterium equinum]|uniref:Polyprenol monophosphomannose synthase n=1 Tax=Cutibacterium equinum TaxID=3016342 RepID=A0ABY7R2M5_9ACTN|nr:polyprenol monophosphomannose synthase [Cutibacterium equinum]WCC80897.1 polyprenol monophosphomannose synthase [Cutibacterium equinum]
MPATDTEVRLDKVLVIIPTYNEAENVETIVARTRRANPKVDVLVADDNSPDGTGEIADRLASADDHVHVMHRKGKEGLGAAYLAGFHWGLGRGYDVLVEMDADGSHQPEQLPLLLEALKHADMVKGSRYVKGGSVVNWPMHRKLISRGGGMWTRMCLGIGVKDPTGGFNAFRANTLRTIGLDEVASAGYCFQLDMTWRTLKKGLTVAEVPIEFIEREYGHSKMSKDIVVEALLRTTLWGVDYRSGQLKELGHLALERVEQVAGNLKERRRKH